MAKPEHQKYLKQKRMAREAGKLPPGVVPIAEKQPEKPGGEKIIIGETKFDYTPELLELKEWYEGLTQLQSNWFDAYLGNRDAGRSAEIAGYKGNSDTLQSIGSKNKVKFQKQIDLMDEYTKTIQGAITELTGVYKFWGETIADTTQSMRDRLKASELFARAMGGFSHENPDININFNSEKFDEIPQDKLEAFIESNTR